MPSRPAVSRARIAATVVSVLASLVLVALHHSLFVTGCGVIGAVCGVAFLASSRRR
jgi:hypothetical protein